LRLFRYAVDGGNNDAAHQFGFSFAQVSQLFFSTFSPVECVAEFLLVFCGVVIDRHVAHHVDVVHCGLARATTLEVFGGRSECAEVVVLDDFVDGGDGFLFGLRLGHVEAGDL
jgi:hypothetical protein